jgi:hypothetical protein
VKLGALRATWFSCVVVWLDWGGGVASGEHFSCSSPKKLDCGRYASVFENIYSSPILEVYASLSHQCVV